MSLRNLAIVSLLLLCAVFHYRLNSVALSLADVRLSTHAATAEVRRKLEELEKRDTQHESHADHVQIDVDSLRQSVEQVALRLDAALRHAPQLPAQAQAQAQTEPDAKRKTASAQESHATAQSSEEAEALRARVDALEAAVAELRRRPRADTGGDEKAQRVENDSGDGSAAQWLAEPRRVAELRSLRARIYDSHEEPIDVLDAVHAALDVLVAQCACGSDGASNHGLQRQVYLNISQTAQPVSFATNNINWFCARSLHLISFVRLFVSLNLFVNAN